MTEYRRRYKLDVSYSLDSMKIKEISWRRATIHDICGKCGNKALEFYSLQLRFGRRSYSCL